MTEAGLEPCMTADPAATMDLLDYRRRVASAYAELREGGAPPEVLCQRFRERKDRLFRDHPASPLSDAQRASFPGLPYDAYDPAWRSVAHVHPVDDPAPFDVDLGEEGRLRLEREALLRFDHDGARLQLVAYRLRSYGGGLFVPFRDLTTGASSYGGGRYLIDTAKHADLGSQNGGLILDFNYAYNPSCAYHARWTCPLAPPENTLPVAVRAGERQPFA